MHTYLDDPKHASWKFHYVGGSKGVLLGFTKEWAKANLPTGLSGRAVYDPKALKVVLLDQQDGKLYETWMCLAYEHAPVLHTFYDSDWREVAVEVSTLQDYFYALHHCPCHRKQDAAAAGAATDDECAGARFLIHSIEAPAQPGLILYSEVLKTAELEDRLLATPDAPVLTAGPSPG